MTAALHLVHGLWTASCPDCGFELCRSRDQAKVERAAARRRCPVCHSAEHGPIYRGLRLLGPLAEFHRAVDRLRWDTARTPPNGHADGNERRSSSRADARPEQPEAGQAGLFTPSD